jgi:hypothetical protein
LSTSPDMVADEPPNRLFGLRGGSIVEPNRSASPTPLLGSTCRVPSAILDQTSNALLNSSIVHSLPLPYSLLPAPVHSRVSRGRRVFDNNNNRSYGGAYTISHTHLLCGISCVSCLICVSTPGDPYDDAIGFPRRHVFPALSTPPRLDPSM